MKNSKFEIIFRDRYEYEKLLVQVRWNNIVLFEVNRENGIDKATIELFCNDPIYNNTEITFSYLEFLEVMKQVQLALEEIV